MASTPVLQIAGLRTSDNPHSAVPPGSLVRAENAVLRYRNRLGPRRGQGYYEHTAGTATTFGSGISRSNEGAFFGGSIVHHYGTSTLARVVSGVGNTDYSGSYTPVDAATLRMKFVEAAQNLYFNTTVGNYLLESLTSTPAKAGIPRAQDDFFAYLPDTHLVASTTGWMATDTAANYRFVWGIKDSHDNVKLGAPSKVLTVRNRLDVAAGSVVRAANVVTVTTKVAHRYIVGDSITLLNPTGTFLAGPYAITVVPDSVSFKYAEVAANASSAVLFKYSTAANVTVPVVIPSGITTSHFLRVYRSEETESADDVPSSDVYLVLEVNPSASDITNTNVVITDRTPSSQLGPPLYTNPNDGDGDTASKFQPPIGKDMCLWDGRLWLFNTTDKHRFNLRLLGIGTPDGLQSNDTITINGRTCTAKAEGAGSFVGGYADPSINQFTVYTSFSTLAQNIEYTMRSLWWVFKYNSSGATVMAYYVSGEDDPPGMMLFEEVAVGGSAFTVYSSRPTAWGPALTTGSSGAASSVNDRRQNGASYSDEGEPEAFQILNWMPVGPKGIEILRAIPFRDKLYAFCANRKVYSITGPAPYRVDELDGSALLIAPDTVKVHSNQVFALTDQGLGILTDSGFRIVSRGIEDEVLDVLALTPATVSRYAFGLSYEADRQYQLWLPTSNGATSCAKGWIYNSLEDTWTGPWTGSRTWGGVSPVDGKLYMGDGASNKLRQERKSFDRTDFYDERLAVTISSYDALATVVLADASGVAAGDLITQFSTYSLITAVNGNTLTILSTSDAGFAGPFAATVLKAFTVDVKFAPLAPAGLSATTHFRELCLHFGEFFAHAFYATFDSESDVTETTALLAAATSWTEATTPAATALGMRNRYAEVPQEHARCSALRVGFRVREAMASWLFDGFTTQGEVAGRAAR